MGHLKQYGKYFVFAAMSVTGVFVWNSQKRTISGEDGAELFNAAVERLAVAPLEGDETPSWPEVPGGGTNLFPSAILSKEFRDELMQMSVQAYFLDASVTYTPPDNTYTNGVLEAPFSRTLFYPEWLLTTNTLYDGSSEFAGAGESLTLTSGTYVMLGPILPMSSGAYLARDFVKPSATLPFPVLDGFTYLTNNMLGPSVGYFGGPTVNGATFSIPFPAEGSSWNTNKGPVSFVHSAMVRPLDRVLRRRDMMEPYNVLSGLATTIKFIDPDTVDVSNKVSSSSAPDVYIPFTPGFDTPDSYFSDCMDSFTNIVYSAGSGLSWGFSITYRATGRRYHPVDPPGPDSDYPDEGTYRVSKTEVSAMQSGQYLTYPSVYAVTNGYVSRIRVFAVFAYSAAGDGYAFSNPGFYQNEFTEGYHPVTPSGIGFSFVDGNLGEGDLSAYDDTYSSFGEQSNFTGNPSGGNLKLTMLMDVADPSSSNDLSYANFTLPSVSFPADVAYYSFSGYNDEPYGTPPDDTYTISEYKYARGCHVSISTRSLFVVVDWNWKHLNPSNPYVPPE